MNSIPQRDPHILWTSEKLDLLRKEISKAKVEGAEVFNFEGHEFFVPYARYLVQFLEGRGL